MKRKARKKSLSKKLQKVQAKKDTEKLVKQTMKLVAKANARLDSLQRRYKAGSWASKNLANRLSSSKMKMWTKQGKIKVSKNLSKTQLRYLNKAVSQFLASQTSTKAGIKKVREKTIDTIQANLSLEGQEISEEDAEKFYNMFGEENFSNISAYIGASALQVVLEDAIEDNVDEEDFIERIKLYASDSMNDLDIRESAKKLYQKYVA